MFLDDTPAYPAAFFGAVRAGFVPLLINTLTPPDLLQFYLADSAATVAVADAEFASRFDARACHETALRHLIVVNGVASDHAVPAVIADLAARQAHLAALQARVAASLGNVSTASSATDQPIVPGQRLNASQLADRMGRSLDYVYRRAKRWPFTLREGRSVSFDEAGFVRWQRAKQRRAANC